MAAEIRPEFEKRMTIICSSRAALSQTKSDTPSGSNGSAEKVLSCHGKVLRGGSDGGQVRRCRGRLFDFAALLEGTGTEKVPDLVMIVCYAGLPCAATHRSHFFSRLSATLPISAESGLLIWWLPITIRSACRPLACSRRQSTRA